MNKIISILLISIFSLASFAAEDVAEFSDSDVQTADTTHHRKVNVKFEDELVKGANDKPDAEFLFQKADFNFKKLIRLRENFIPEVQKGKDHIRGIK